jgi:hypothetical protein
LEFKLTKATQNSCILCLPRRRLIFLPLRGWKLKKWVENYLPSGICWTKLQSSGFSSRFFSENLRAWEKLEKRHSCGLALEETQVNVIRLWGVWGGVMWALVSSFRALRLAV